MSDIKTAYEAKLFIKRFVEDIDSDDLELLSTVVEEFRELLINAIKREIGNN